MPNSKDDPLLSPCCKAGIFDTEGIFGVARCCACKKTVQWAFQLDSWAREESCAVFTGVDGKKYFAWQSIRNFEVAKYVLNRGDPFVCFHNGGVVSLTAELNMYGDQIPFYEHQAFVLQWLAEVENPEVGAVIL